MAPSARRPLIGGNWKCNGTKDSIATLCAKLNEAKFSEKDMDVVICPSTIHIPLTVSKLDKKFIVAAQNCSKTGNGAFTGETSLEMLKDMGLSWTLIGHSERRTLFGENDQIVADKVELAQKAGISVILCIGELLSEREANKTVEVCTRQLNACIPKISDWTKIVVAYEPIWAIGTGKVATPQQAQEAHAAIRKLLTEKVSAAVSSSVRIVYGGSVSESNCAELIKLNDVDGFLVGGASLKPTFVDIINCANCGQGKC